MPLTEDVGPFFEGKEALKKTIDRNVGLINSQHVAAQQCLTELGYQFVFLPEEVRAAGLKRDRVQPTKYASFLDYLSSMMAAILIFPELRPNFIAKLDGQFRTFFDHPPAKIDTTGQDRALISCLEFSIISPDQQHVFLKFAEQYGEKLLEQIGRDPNVRQNGDIFKLLVPLAYLCILIPAFKPQVKVLYRHDKALKHPERLGPDRIFAYEVLFGDSLVELTPGGTIEVKPQMPLAQSQPLPQRSLL